MKPIKYIKYTPHFAPYPNIVGVAIWYKPTNLVYCLPEPNRHHNVLDLMKASIPDRSRQWDKEVQGFVSSFGMFLTREEAYQLALLNGQLKRVTGPKLYNGIELFSEDLW